MHLIFLYNSKIILKVPCTFFFFFFKIIAGTIRRFSETYLYTLVQWIFLKCLQGKGGGE